MRKTVSFVVACALLLAGLWLLYYQIFISDVIKGLLLMVSGVLVAAGGGWLLSDYILPLFRQQRRRI